MGTYTVRQATATGITNPKYGTEYIVHFNEDDREVKMSRQKPIELGQEENGTIVDSKYGAYFKKDPFVPSAPAPTAGTSAPRASFGKPTNSDGMRQGMCINNAAGFVNSQHPSDPARLPLSPSEWASSVHSYATALYSLGDLKETEAITPETVQGIFSGN